MSFKQDLLIYVSETLFWFFEEVIQERVSMGERGVSQKTMKRIMDGAERETGG